MTFFPYGDTAILVNFEQKITHEIHNQVQILTKKIEQSKIQGVTSLIPAYCSLTVVFDIQQTSYQEVITQIKTLQNIAAPDLDSNEKTTLINIPVCYEREFALDLVSLSDQLQLSTQEIIEKHTAQNYRVFMIGFLPGFPYLGILPKELACQRKSTPRLKVPARSVGIAGFQTGIYPTEAPGGWQIIGKTPIDIFRTNCENPFLLEAGNQVKFYSIKLASFRKIEKDLINNTFNFQEIYG